MQPSHQHHHSRINLAELKAQIVKKIGPDTAKQYFYCLNRFLSLKLTKIEFNRMCIRIIGRENIPLHNQLIRSVLRNGCTAKVPPPVSRADNVLKGKEDSGDGYRQNGSHAAMSEAYGFHGLSNGGDVLPLSPRKARTGFRDRRMGDRRSALGPNGKTCFASQSSDCSVPLENGDVHPSDAGRSAQQHQGSMQQMENGNEIMFRRSLDGLVSPRDDRKVASARSPLRPPLGVQFCPVSTSTVQKMKPPSSSQRCTGTLNDALLDSPTLQERMEQISVAHGLEGVSMDSANILNRSLDSYMKGLIRSCIELVGSQSGHELTRNNTNKHQSCMKLIYGVRPGHQYPMQNSGRPMEVQEAKLQCPISLQDFRVAMELNPQKLRVDWPLLLEKICTHPFEQ